MKKEPLIRTWFLSTGVLCIAIFLVGQLAYIQIILGESYQSKAEQQYNMLGVGLFDRGSIFFQEKTGRKISAAIVAPDYTLAIDPTLVDNPAELAKKLFEVAGVDPAVVMAKAKRSGDQYEEVAEHLSEEVVRKIKELGVKGIILKKDKKRFYPGGKSAAHILGFVGWDKDVRGGQYGLERYYDETLARSGKDTPSYFFTDLFLKQGKSILSDRVRAGNIVTTIEPSVQGFLERILADEIRTRYSADEASGIIMNPKTGEMYAMASEPSFDPNNFSKEKNQAVFKNSLVEGSYEMGSIVKALTMAAGLDAGVVTSATTYDDKGSRIVNTKRISNFDGKARGVVPMQKVLNESLNLGSMFVGERLGHGKFREYFKAFGLGEETGIDLPNEGVGSLKNLESSRDIEYATASFGQGISMTPIGTIRALSALANGGVLVTPHVVKRTEYQLGLSHNFVPGNERRVIKKETSAEISRMLTEVVDTALLEGSLKMERYRIAAKTGTAQQVGANGKYSESDFLHTFFGYFPAQNPQFIIYLQIKNPRGERYASHTLSKPFMQIAKFLINYYEVPPDR